MGSPTGQQPTHLLINNLHDKFQYAYRIGFFTETALIKMTDDILHALDNKSFTALIMIDMSAAFDAVDHTILLNRLSKCFGITYRLTALSWFKSYLSYRNQCVSEPRLLSSGVPQDFMLAPLLFNLSKTQYMVFSRKKSVSNVLDDNKSLCIIVLLNI